MINQKFMKLCTLQDPIMKMCTLVVYPGSSSFPRFMSLKVVFQICFGSIKMMGTQGVLVPRSVQLSYSIYVSELQIKKNSCQTLGPASKRALPDLSTFCQTYLFFRNFLIFHFQYSMIKGTILKP